MLTHNLRMVVTPGAVASTDRKLFGLDHPCWLEEGAAGTTTNCSGVRQGGEARPYVSITCAVKVAQSLCLATI